MSGASVDRSWNPDVVRVWHGPRPHEGHRLLIAACLDERIDAACEHWRNWWSVCDFEHEDAGSYELAAIAVERLGDRAGDSPGAARCRGWARRARVVSTLGLDAGRRAASVIRDAGFETIAVGDLAEHVHTELSTRCIELLAVGVPEDVLVAARAAARSGPAAGSLESGKLPLGLGPNAAWHGRWFDGTKRPIVVCEPRDARAATPWSVPIVEEVLAMLLARGWRRNPPGGPRWTISAHRILSRAADVDPRLVAAAAERDDTVTLLRGALRALRQLRGFDRDPIAARLDALVRATAAAERSLRDRWRSARAVRPSSWWLGRAADWIRHRSPSTGR